MDYRIAKLREYLVNIIKTLTNNQRFRINANMLEMNDNNIESYSLDKVPTNTEIEKWIIGVSKKKDVFSFRSRKFYSQDTINNLNNIGFFEEFEKIIKSNNDKGILPDIENIEDIECLNCGTLNNVDGTQATFDIQIQITYIDKNEGGGISL